MALCESGWTGDRCSFPLFHLGLHSDETDGDCDHEMVDTDDIADGVVGGGVAHVYQSICRRCGAELVLSEPDEDGDQVWEVRDV